MAILTGLRFVCPGYHDCKSCHFGRGIGILSPYLQITEEEAMEGMTAAAFGFEYTRYITRIFESA